MNTAKLLRKQLDTELSKWKIANHSLTPPKLGWIHRIRSALNMTQSQLGARLDVSKQRIAQLQTGEQAKTLTLKSLEMAAKAMNCQLVYAFIPIEESLEKTIYNQAKRYATLQINRIQHSMRLEQQNLTDEQQKTQLDESIRELSLSNKIWNVR